MAAHFGKGYAVLLRILGLMLMERLMMGENASCVKMRGRGTGDAVFVLLVSGSFC